ncbi:ROK family protein [Allofustis seminis]|uniref:ROK family protein n=1 Tax=Allofustis seminis TaxID=166939 RepID=UPI0003811C53|nr:ROK family protein [Allofustis seminis]
MYGAIEAGGTKFVCAVSAEDFSSIEKVVIDTGQPQQTLQAVFDFFDRYPLKAMGIGSFGPIDLDQTSKTYGYIMETPKLEWKNFDMLGAFVNRYNIPIGWNTDVNIAALAEATLGVAKQYQSCLYLTVGTGVGGGIVVDHKIFNKKRHGELGHIRMKKLPGDQFCGVCPYHEDCLEGLVSGPAIEKRSGKKGIYLAEDDEIWGLVSYYIAQALVDYTYTLSPDCIILGGGVMHQKHLLPRIKAWYQKLNNHYMPVDNLDDYIVEPALGDEAGLYGGLVLAKEQYNIGTSH